MQRTAAGVCRQTTRPAAMDPRSRDGCQASDGTPCVRECAGCGSVQGAAKGDDCKREARGRDEHSEPPHVSATARPRIDGVQASGHTPDCGVVVSSRHGAGLGLGDETCGPAQEAGVQGTRESTGVRHAKHGMPHEHTCPMMPHIDAGPPCCCTVLLCIC